MSVAASLIAQMAPSRSAWPCGLEHRHEALKGRPLGQRRGRCPRGGFSGFGRRGILAWFDSHIANGLIEGINSLVQAAKAKARGYRSIRALKAIAYLIAGKLDLRLPT